MPSGRIHRTLVTWFGRAQPIESVEVKADSAPAAPEPAVDERGARAILVSAPPPLPPEPRAAARRSLPPPPEPPAAS
jgi:hypothetical protein